MPKKDEGSTKYNKLKSKTPSMLSLYVNCSPEDTADIKSLGEDRLLVEQYEFRPAPKRTSTASINTMHG